MHKNNVKLVELPASVLSEIAGGTDKPKPQPKPDSPPPKKPEVKPSDTIKPFLWIWD